MGANWPIRAPRRWRFPCNSLKTFTRRWVVLLKPCQPDDFARTFRHPELGLVRLDTNLALYAWHGRHHAAHITGLTRKKRLEIG